MMHNGSVPQFPKIKRRLLSLLSDELFLWVKGQTDSEHIFALLMQHISDLRGSAPAATAEQMKQGFQQTFDVVEDLKQEAGIGHEVSTFNMMTTDGYRLFGTRFSSDPKKETRTLYYSTGSRFQCQDGASRMVQDESGDKAVLIVSEKLNEHEEEWTPIPPNQFIAIESNMEISLSPLQCH
jgi:predicted glutamine amidotransferase